MELNENLTHLQKTALQGEIALVLSSAPHNAELKYRSFILLKEVAENLRPFVLQGIKEFVDIPETEIDRIMLEVQSHTIPVWLWIEKSIEDLRMSLELNENIMVGGRAKINKKDCRKSIIESAFVYFVRSAMSISLSAASQLCSEVLDCNDLEFLHSSSFYLLSVCKELSEIEKPQNKVPKKLLDCTFNLRDILSFKLESKALDMLNKAELEPEWSPRTTHEGEFTHVIQMDSETGKGLTTEELSNFLSQKITELFEGVSKENTNNTPPISKPQNSHRYVVKKVFKGSHLTTVLKNFKNIEDAVEFKNKIEKELPELLKTCEFIIEEG